MRYEITLTMSQPQEATIYVEAETAEEAMRVATTDLASQAEWRDAGEPFGLTVEDVELA